jgi:hypothetical protein
MQVGYGQSAAVETEIPLCADTNGFARQNTIDRIWMEPDEYPRFGV